MLEQNLLDLVISSSSEAQALVKVQRLCSKQNYLSVYRRQEDSPNVPLSLPEFAARPQIRVSTHEQFENAIDTVLTKRRLKRRVMLQTPHSLSVPFIVSQTRLLANLPCQMAVFTARLLGLAVSPLPVELDSYQITMLWHSSYDLDSGHHWLRKTVEEAAAEMQPFTEKLVA